MRNYILHELEMTRLVTTKLIAEEAIITSIERSARLCADAIRENHKILFAGNGGSAADAQHLAAELVGRFCKERPGISAFALTTDSSIITALSNDYGYERVFARQVEAVGQVGDIFVGISTSGRSQNIISGLIAAKQIGLGTIGLTGLMGGDMAAHCDELIRIPSDETPHIQEGHITVGHVVCGLIEQELFG